MRAERIEDLGRIREKLIQILEQEFIDHILAEEDFICLYTKTEKSEDYLNELWYNLKYLRSQLWEVFEIAKGVDYDEG